MATLSKTAYIPPHIRIRNATNAPKANLVLGSTAINGSSEVSLKSGTHLLTQAISSPATAKIATKSPASPPTTTHNSERPNVNERATLEEPQLDISNPAQNLQNRKGLPGGYTAPKKKFVWPNAQETRHIPANNESDGGVSFKSHSNGDPDYDVKKLLDWKGDWMPPPVEWSARKGFTGRHLQRDIEQWIEGQPSQCHEKMPLESDAYRGRETNDDGEVKHVLVGGTCKDIVPRYWMSATVEGKSMRQFWTEMPDRSPDVLSDIDVTADQPWWNLYEDSPSCFITGLAVPEARVDSKDSRNYGNPSGLASAEERVQEKLRRIQRKHQKLIAKRNRPLLELRPLVPPVEDRRIRPTVNVYLRPVQPTDVAGITAIYNHYVENTFHANEFDARSEHQIRDRINDIVNQGLPYLVAVARSNPSLKPRGFISEKIVGYINLDDYCDQSSMYRFTFEMELFVHPGYTHKGIAKCLLDQLLYMANTGYKARRGYEYVNEYEYLKNGPSRVIKTILLTVHHEHGEDIKWVSEYLSPFKFVRAGHISKVGFKKSKIVDISTFQHHTTEDIDPNGIPSVPLERG